MAHEEIVSVIIWKTAETPFCLFSSFHKDNSPDVHIGDTLSSYTENNEQLENAYNRLLEEKEEQLIMSDNIQTMMFYLKDGLLCELKINTDNRLECNSEPDECPEQIKMEEKIKQKIKYETSRWLNNLC